MSRVVIPRARTRRRAGVAAVLLLTACATCGPAHAEPADDARSPARAGWTWPTGSVRVVAPYLAPAHAYGAGHRGVDLAAAYGEPVRSPADGVVVFVGTVVDRGILTIDHGSDLITTLEPVRASVAPGEVVHRGEVVGTVDAGGHTPAGAVHFGVREDSEYINPLLLLGGVAPAVLLPCC